MSKTPIVHAVQKWEYLFFTRKSEPALYNELLVVGQEGWELVNTHYYKDPKGVMTWIAFCKRPCLGATPAAGPAKAAGVASETVRPTPSEQPKGFDLEGDVFEIKKE